MINRAPEQEARPIPTASPPQPEAAWLLPPRPTEVILANVTNGIYTAGVNGPFYVIISLDFSVTFDTLSHLLFLKKTLFCSFCDMFPCSPPPFLSEHFLSSLLFSGCSSNLGSPHCPAPPSLLSQTCAFCVVRLLRDDLRRTHIFRCNMDTFCLEFFYIKMSNCFTEAVF